VRAASYSSKPVEKYFEASGQVLVVIQLEGREAIRNLDSILEVEGIDILFIGPYDLSQSLGHPGKTDHPDVIAAMSGIVKKASAMGRIIGTFTETPAGARRWKEAGVQYLSYSVDVGIFTAACRQLVSDLSNL
jgi:4-hydroxy-2-oxoheptanedioate aldolase